MSNDGQRNYKNLLAWQRAHELTLEIYKRTGEFPTEEKYGLTSQLRRASFSVAANIAEGCGRGSDKDFLRFLYISLGSLKEVEYAILLARDLDYIPVELHEELTSAINQTFAVLQGLIKSVKKKTGVLGTLTAIAISTILLTIHQATTA